MNRVMESKVSDHLANERTYLAWLRTGIATIGLGFVVAKFGLALRQLTGVSALPETNSSSFKRHRDSTYNHRRTNYSSFVPEFRKKSTTN